MMGTSGQKIMERMECTVGCGMTKWWQKGEVGYEVKRGAQSRCEVRSIQSRERGARPRYIGGSVQTLLRAWTWDGVCGRADKQPSRATVRHYVVARRLLVVPPVPGEKRRAVESPCET